MKVRQQLPTDPGDRQPEVGRYCFFGYRTGEFGKSDAFSCDYSDDQRVTFVSGSHRSDIVDFDSGSIMRGHLRSPRPSVWSTSSDSLIASSWLRYAWRVSESMTTVSTNW